MSYRRVLVLYAFLACAAFAQEAPTPASSFSEVARHLNTDGDFYLFLNSEQVHDELLELSNFVESILVGSQTAPERASTRRIFAAVRHFLGETGLAGMRAVGMSSQRRADGRFANRSVIYHGAEPITGRLWQMGAGDPHPLTGHMLMPANTVFSFSGDLRLDLLWELVNGLAKKMGPDAVAALRSMRKDWAKQGQDLDAVWGDFSGEVTVVVTLDPKQRRSLSPEIDLPELAIMLVATVKDQTLFSAADQLLSEALKLARPKLAKDAKALMLDHGHPKHPFRIQPTIAKSANRVFLASNPDVIAAALAVQAGGPGLAESAEFATLRQGLPERGNQLVFLSNQLSQELKRVTAGLIALKQGQTQAGNARAWEGKADQLGKFHVHGVPVEPNVVLAKAFANSATRGDLAALTDNQSCTITVNYPDARVSYGHGSTSLSRSLLAPAFLSTLVSIAVPAIKEAREKARTAADFAALKSLGVATIAYAQQNDGALPKNFRELVGPGLMPKRGKAWDSVGTAEETNTPESTDFVYLGEGLHTRADQHEARVLAHTAPGAFGGKWVLFVFLDGHVSKLPGASPSILAKSKGWIYGIQTDDRKTLAAPDSYGFRLSSVGELVLLDAADEREVARVHPSEAFDRDMQLTAIAPWEQLCWVGSSQGLFRFDPRTRSWSRYAVARTLVDVSVDALEIRDRKLFVSYDLETATFDLDTREWLSAAVAAAEPEQAARPMPPGISLGLIELLLVVVAVGGLLLMILLRKRSA